MGRTIFSCNIQNENKRAEARMNRLATAAYCRESETGAITALCNQPDIVKEFIYSRKDLKFLCRI